MVVFYRIGAHIPVPGIDYQAVKQLQELGYSGARNVDGGILAWIDRIDPSQPKY